MSEEPKSKVESDLQKLDDFLDSYEKKVGLNGLTDSDISKYLSLTQDQLQKMSGDECAEAAFLLQKEAMYIQHELNKHKAQMDWAKARIARAIAAEIHNYGSRYSTNETREILAVKGNNYAQDLQKIVDKAERVIARLSYLPNNLHNLSNVLLNYRYTKTRSDKDETTRTS